MGNWMGLAALAAIGAAVTSHRIPATRFRHIPASWTGAEEHLAGPQEWLDLVGLASSRGLAEGAAGGASLGAR